MADKAVISNPNLKIEWPQDDRIVNYCNFAIVSHSPEEFVIDFARILPGKDEAKIVSRIIMTPKNAKNFVTAMSTNVSNYERQYGEIVIPESPVVKFSEIQ